MKLPRRNGFHFDHYTIERQWGNFLRFTAVTMGIWTNSISIQRASDTKRNRDITNDILSSRSKHQDLDLAKFLNRLSHMTCEYQWFNVQLLVYNFNVPQGLVAARTLGGSYQFILAGLHSFHVISIHRNSAESLRLPLLLVRSHSFIRSFLAGLYSFRLVHVRAPLLFWFVLNRLDSMEELRTRARLESCRVCLHLCVCFRPASQVLILILFVTFSSLPPSSSATVLSWISSS